MAVSAATVTVNSTDITQKNLIAYGTIAIGASPGTYPTGGYTVDFSGAALPVSSPPTWVEVESSPVAASPGTTKFIYQFLEGTTIKNGKLQVFVQDAVAANPLLELAAAATPAGVSGDTITFRAVFLRL